MTSRTKTRLVSTLAAAAMAGILSMSPAIAAEKSAKPKQEEVITQVNINKASASELEMLKGVGKKKAEAIVAYRSKVGKFKSIEQLAEVKGIGAKTVEKNRHMIAL